MEANRWRIIPQLEKYPGVVRFAQTAAGRAVLVTVFALIFYSFQFTISFPAEVTWSEIAMLFILGAFNLPRSWKLAAAILWTLIFTGYLKASGFSGEADVQAGLATLTHLQFRLDRSPYIFKGLALLCAFGFFEMSLRFLKRIRSRAPIFWLFPLWAALLSFTVLSPDDSDSFLVAGGIFALVSISIFPLCYFHLTRDPQRRMRVWEWISFPLQGLIVPLQLTYLRSPRSEREKLPAQDFAILQIKALKLLLWARLISLLNDGVCGFLFRHLEWPNYNWIGFAKYNALHIGAGQTWALILLNNFYLFCLIAANSGIAVATYRLAGFDLPRSTYRPHMAAGFLDYYRRCFYYYGEILIHLFFQPLFRFSGRLFSSRTLRTQFALFLAVFAGGWIFHVLFVWQQFLLFDTDAVLSGVFSWIPYFLMMAALCCWSTGSGRKQSSFPWPARFAFNFSAQAVLLVFFQYRLHESWATRFEFIKSLIP